MFGSKNDSEPHSKRVRFVSRYPEIIIVFFSPRKFAQMNCKIDRKVNEESASTRNYISAHVHDSNNPEGLQNAIDYNVQKNIFVNVLNIDNFIDGRRSK